MGWAGARIKQLQQATISRIMWCVFAALINHSNFCDIFGRHEVYYRKNTIKSGKESWNGGNAIPFT